MFTQVEAGNDASMEVNDGKDDDAGPPSSKRARPTYERLESKWQFSVRLLI